MAAGAESNQIVGDQFPDETPMSRGSCDDGLFQAIILLVAGSQTKGRRALEFAPVASSGADRETLAGQRRRDGTVLDTSVPEKVGHGLGEGGNVCKGE